MTYGVRIGATGSRERMTAVMPARGALRHFLSGAA